MKHLVFLVHGICRNNADGSKEIVQCLTGIAQSLPNSPECKGPEIVAELAQIKFVEIYYDDFLQEVTRLCFEKPQETLDTLKAAGLGALQEIFTTDAAQGSFLRDNIFDVVVYRLYQEHRWAIQRMVMKQIKQGLADAASRWGLGNVKKSVLAHSLGTIVTHDVLNQLAQEEGQFSYANGWHFDNLFMLANVSALAHNETDPRESFVRPYLSPNRPGYVRNYYDFAHDLDPVAQVIPFKKWMENVPGDGFSYCTTYLFNLSGDRKNPVSGQIIWLHPTFGFSYEGGWDSAPLNALMLEGFRPSIQLEVAGFNWYFFNPRFNYLGASAVVWTGVTRNEGGIGFNAHLANWVTLGLSLSTARNISFPLFHPSRWSADWGGEPRLMLGWTTATEKALKIFQKD